MTAFKTFCEVIIFGRVEKWNDGIAKALGRDRWGVPDAKGSPYRRGDRLVARSLRPPGHPEARSILKNFPRQHPPLEGSKR